MTALDVRPSSREPGPREPGPREPGPRELGPRELAGYRVLRSLARDDDGEVLLGHRRGSAVADDTRTDGPHTVAIKVLPSSESGWASALGLCEALERARGDHVVDLLDVDADDASIRLVFERLPRGDLAELLRTRQRIDAGEAVTVLAPIASAVLRMHAAGVAHGNLSARSVLFRDDGSPTIIGFSHADLFEPGAPEIVLEQVEAVRKDRSAVAGLAVIVLGRIDGDRARAARELVADLEECEVELAVPLLAERLFEVAAALPIRFAPDLADVDIAPSKWRAIPVGTPDEEPSTDSAVGSSRWTVALARLVPEPLLQRVLDTAGSSAAAPVVEAAVGTARRHWRSWSTGRRRAVLAVAAAAVTVGAVTVIAPTAPAASRSAAAPSASMSPDARKTPSMDEQVTAGDPPISNEPAISGDDPVAATSLLVSGRDRCLSSLSLRCLDLVDESGSSALSDDQAAIREGQRGGELPDPLSGSTDPGAVALIERLGDSALVRLGRVASDASLLLVKGDKGWRIRDVIAGVAHPSPTPTSPTPTAPKPSGG